MKKFLKIFYKILIIFLIFILVYVMYSKFVLKEKVTKVFGYGFLVVISGSMEPEIKKGELIVIKDNSKYLIGDIITYKENDLLVTHRIVEIPKENFYITKGDSNNTEDLEISKDKIIGKVIFHSSKLGNFIVYYLHIFLIGLIILIGTIAFFIERNKSLKELKFERKV